MSGKPFQSELLLISVYNIHNSNKAHITSIKPISNTIHSTKWLKYAVIDKECQHNSQMTNVQKAPKACCTTRILKAD